MIKIFDFVGIILLVVLIAAFLIGLPIKSVFLYTCVVALYFTMATHWFKYLIFNKNIYSLERRRLIYQIVAILSWLLMMALNFF